MVDNVRINPMSGGDVIAADDVDGVKYQRVKIGYGADGAFSDIGTDAPLPAFVLSGVSVGADRAVLATVGQPTQLPDHPQICGVTVRASLGNTGIVYVGGPAVSAADGFELAPGEAVSVDVVNTSAVYIDGEHPSDSVRLLWVNA